MKSVQDKKAEFLHNQRIFEKAEVFWGWGTPAGEKRGLRRVQKILEYLQPCAGKHFLELGCGQGWFTQHLRDSGARISAFDIQKAFVEIARKRIPDSHVDFFVADSEFLPFAGEIFDGSYGAVVLHHLPMETTLKELCRVLKPGAKIIFTEPNMLNPQLLVMKNIRWIGRRMGESPNETAFFKWQMRAVLKRHGFSDIQVEPFDFLHPMTPVSWIPKVQRMEGILERTPYIREIAGSLDIRAVRSSNGASAR